MNKSEEAIKELREMLPPGSTIYTKINHVSRSGMMRSISCYISEDGAIKNINWWILNAMGKKIDRYDGIRMDGCGMDMGFALVYSVSRILYSDGFDCIGDKCPSNDHFNRVAASHHSDGGYALKQRWL